MTNCLLEKYFENIKNFHKMYNKMEDENTLANYVVEDDLDYDEFTYDDFLTIEDVQKICKWKINWNFGDLVSFSSYRDTWTYIIGKEGKLIDNGCYDGGAGYLTIPYQITKYLKDAKRKYNNLNHILFIDLRYDDEWIENYIGKLDPNWNLKYTWDRYENGLIININDLKKYIKYQINEKNQEKWMEFKKCNNSLNEECIDIIKKYFGVIDYNNIKEFYMTLNLI